MPSEWHLRQAQLYSLQFNDLNSPDRPAPYRQPGCRSWLRRAGRARDRSVLRGRRAPSLSSRVVIKGRLSIRLRDL